MITGFIYRGLIIHHTSGIMQDINTTAPNPERFRKLEAIFPLAPLGNQSKSTISKSTAY